MTKKSSSPAAAAGRVSWLDDAGQKPRIEEYARKMQTFIDTMADGRVTKDELAAQEERLVALLKEVEPTLDDAQHEKVTRLLCELTAYDLMQALHTLQEAQPKGKHRWNP